MYLKEIQDGKLSTRAILRPRHYVCPRRRRRIVPDQTEIIFIIEYQV